MPRSRVSKILRSTLVVAVALTAMPAAGEEARRHSEEESNTGTASSIDAVPIAYSSWGSGRPALVFVHGGFADSEFWKEQVEPLANDFQIVTLDLAGHGQSGSDREQWSIDAFGEDVRAVVEALELGPVILVGNSLGGPVALSAAKKIPGVIGLIAVDTFQDVKQQWTRPAIEAYIESLRDDFPAACLQMMDQLLVEGTEPELARWVEERMCGFDRTIAHRVVSAFLDYDGAAAFAAASIPIRAILGETVPLDLAGNRELHSNFDAVIMERCGHYPMLDRPGEFNQHLRSFVAELLRQRGDSAEGV